jgi:hypothetical protein
LRNRKNRNLKESETRKVIKERTIIYLIPKRRRKMCLREARIQKIHAEKIEKTKKHRKEKNSLFTNKRRSAETDKTFKIKQV